MSEAHTAQDREISAGRGAALVSAVALLLTVLMAAPVVLSPSERVFGSGDILSREDPSRDALVVINQFRTGEVPSPYLQPLTDLPGRALAWLVGPVFAYNVVVLATFPLAALAAYLLSRHLFASHLAAVVAGLAYAFLPFHVLQAGGHPHVAQTQWLPLYLLALWRCIDRPSPVRALFVVAAAAAVTLADFYAGFIAAVMSPVALLAYGAGSVRPSTSSRARRVGATILVLIVSAIIGLGAIRIVVPALAADPGAWAFPRAELFAWSARWWSYLVPPADHPIWGGAVREFWNRRGVVPTLLEHQQVSLSLSLVLLSLVPLWGFLRGGRSKLSNRLAAVLAVVAAAALLCSMSPERTIGGFTFVRPSAALYSLAPMFRAYARFGVMVGLMTSLLAGAGVAMLWGRARWGKTAAAALLAIAAIEYAPFPPWRSRDVLPTAAHRFLRSQPAPIRVLDCVEPARVSDTLAAPLLGHPISFMGAAGLDDCGEPQLGDKLAALGYTHALVRRDTPVGAWLADNRSRFAARSRLTPVVEFRDASVLVVNVDRPRAWLGSWLGFYPREYEGAHTWRWMAGVGTIRLMKNAFEDTHLQALSVTASDPSYLWALPVIANDPSYLRGVKQSRPPAEVALTMAPDESEATLDFELRSFPGSRLVEWSVDGQKGVLEVTTGWRRYPLRLPPSERGETAITFSCLEPAVIAGEVLRNHDPRALCLAIGEWSFQMARP